MRCTIVVLVFAVIAMAGCKKKPTATPPSAPAAKRELGANCKQTSDCRDGLACIAEVCSPAKASQVQPELERANKMAEDHNDRAINGVDRSIK